MSERDFEYENLNRASDWQYENGIKCKNYELCDSVLHPDWFINTGNYLCPSCDTGMGFGWKELEFIDVNAECCICFNIVTRKLKFPTNCGHSFCISCSKNILFWDETRYHLSPVPYGCPPCPNNCDNPIKGKQCYCEEQENIQNLWELEKPEEYETWNNAEDLSIYTGEEEGSVFGSKTCPLCRSVYQ